MSQLSVQKTQIWTDFLIITIYSKVFIVFGSLLLFKEIEYLFLDFC